MNNQFMNYGRLHGNGFSGYSNQMGISPNRQQLKEVLMRIGDSPTQGHNNNGPGSITWTYGGEGGVYSPSPSQSCTNRPQGTLGGYRGNPYA